MKTISGGIYFVLVLGFFIHAYLGQAMEREGDVSQESGGDFPNIDAFTMDFPEYKEQLEEAVMHLKDSADNGCINSQWSLGLFYQDELDLHPSYQNLTFAEYYLKQAAKKINNYTAYFQLARFIHKNKSNCVMQAQIYYGYAYRLWQGENNFNEAQLKYYEIQWNFLKKGCQQIECEENLTTDYCTYIFNFYKGLCEHCLIFNGGGAFSKQQAIAHYATASNYWNAQFGENEAQANIEILEKLT